MPNIEETVENWADDRFKRKSYADFLTGYLTSKVAATDECAAGRSFTIALDAAWGQGKTFFVRHWANDLRRATPPYPVVMFDAWSADNSTDPLVSFMASIKAALEDEIRLAGLAPTVRATARRELQKAIKGLRRAMLPAGKTIAAAVLKKATGVAVEELTDALAERPTASKGSPVEDSVQQQAKDVALDAVNKGLDTFFKKALEEQTDRLAAIADFRTSLEKALNALCVLAPTEI